MALVKSQCSLPGDTSLLETTELLTKLPPADLLNVMSCKVTLCPATKYQPSFLNNKSHLHFTFFLFFLNNKTCRSLTSGSCVLA